LRPGDELELSVESLAHGGNGVARLDGYVVFVRGGFPGDRVRARVTKRKRSYAEASAEELIDPSPERVEPRASHPGAPWQVLPYERQLREKHAQVIDALERIGGFERPPVEPAMPAVEPWGYRNKVEYSFGRSPDGELVVGFHRPGRWDRIEPIERDVLASERVDALRRRVADWARGEGLSGHDRADGTGLLRNLVVREGRRTGDLQARLVTGSGDLRVEAFAAAARAGSVLRTRDTGPAETTRGGETELIAGEEAIEEEVTAAGRTLRFRISPEAFFQTNTEMAERLYAVAAELAGLSGSERVFDLYSGIGTIALGLAPASGEVWGVESVKHAVSDAIANAELNGIDNTRFFAGDVRTAMRPLLERAGRPNVVVVDPPRAGLSQKVVRRVLEAGASRILYVSCNPTTLAPNARQLTDAGYRLATVRPVDMFPQTPHIECVALLERPDA
ncbi:MAG TPA: 23S rRNA (uracil(1939)-C(5))-methyltransferase RlmD, partial [Thermoleophilaceae bacterium]|nr:23S rRNA (uracil(1939)-C(5))-methyltransferase RlmD [Thermoleophilaceae bacterium]